MRNRAETSDMQDMNIRYMNIHYMNMPLMNTHVKGRFWAFAEQRLT
jgi:hypothetical protein